MKHYVEIRIPHDVSLYNKKMATMKMIRFYTGFDLRKTKQYAEELENMRFIRMEVAEARSIEYTVQGAKIARQLGILVNVKSENYLKDIKFMITDALACNDFEEVKRLCDVAMSFDTL